MPDTITTYTMINSVIACSRITPGELVWSSAIRAERRRTRAWMAIHQPCLLAQIEAGIPLSRSPLAPPDFAHDEGLVYRPSRRAALEELARA